MTTLRRCLASASAAACLALAACGGGDDAASTTSQEAASSPESRIVPDAQVTAGLGQLKGVAAQVASASDGDASREASEELEPVWEKIEGTVKRNEPDLYIEVEDGLQLLSTGDLDKARRGEQRMDRAVDAYLAKHPG